MRRSIFYIVLFFVTIFVGYSQSSAPHVAIDRIEDEGLNRFICSSGIYSLDSARNISWRYRVGVIESNEDGVPQYMVIVTLKSVSPLYPRENCSLMIRFQDRDFIELKNIKLDKGVDSNGIHTNVMYFVIEDFEFRKFKKGIKKVYIDVVGGGKGIEYLYREDVIGSFLYKCFLKVKERLHSDAEVSCC